MNWAYSCIRSENGQFLLLALSCGFFLSDLWLNNMWSKGFHHLPCHYKYFLFVDSQLALNNVLNLNKTYIEKIHEFEDIKKSFESCS